VPSHTLHAIGEPVELVASFSARAAYPQPTEFRWQGRTYLVRAIHLVHERREGSTRFLVYSLAAGGGVFQLRFDGGRARWILDGVFELEE